MRLFRWFIGRHLLQHPLRSATTVLSIAVGVAVVLAIQLANASSVRGFEVVLDAVAGRTSLEITAPGATLDETRLSELDWLRTYGLVSPVIDADVRLTVPGAVAGDVVDGDVTRLLGVDILRDRPFRDYALADADTPTGQAVSTRDFLDLLTDPRGVVLTRRFADDHGLTLGDDVVLLVGDRERPLVVAGVLDDVGPARALDGHFALMDIAAAQWALDRIGRVDRVDVRLKQGIDVAETEARIRARLPAGLSVDRPARRGAEVERMLRAFHFNLTALSLIALLVGLFLVYNTVSVSVITRRGEIGVLRTVGTPRRVILGLFLGEAVAMAVVGCAVGAPLGWVLAQAAVGLTSSTVSQFWVATAAAVPPLDAASVGLAFAVGVPLAAVAAGVPALEAARLAPMAAVRSDDHLRGRARLPRRFVIGPCLLFVAGAGLATRGPIGGLPVYGLLAALAVVFGAALLVPAVLFAARRVGDGPLARWLRVEGRLAHASLGGAIPRLAISVAALAVSLAMMVAIAIMVGSFRQTVIYWVGQTLQADLFVSTARRSPVGDRAGLSEAAERIIAAHPAVAAVDGFAGTNVPYDDTVVVVGSGRFDVLLDHGGLLFKSPADGRAAMATAVGADAVVVSESFALKHGKGVGDIVELATPAGPAPFRVAAVYYDYSSDRGLVMMDSPTFARHYEARRPAGLSVYLRDGADVDLVRDELLAALGRARIFINTNATLRAEVLRIFDSTFAITYALEAIAIVVSLFGVAVTLLTLALERRAELALLRLVGAERRQIRRMIMIEAGVLGGVSQTIGLVVGTALSLILIYVINVQSFGWTIQFHLPVTFLVQSTLLILAASVVAGLYPARLAGRFGLGGLSVEK